jgi:hypothetical protein
MRRWSRGVVVVGGGEDEEGEFKKADSPIPSQGPKVFNVQSFLLCRSPPTDMYPK